MVLLKLFEKLPDDLKNNVFIDYGCGKGRALFCAEYNGFNKLVGVELDKELVAEAKENLRSYSKKRPESSFDLVCINALDYKIPNEASVFYFFNPFSESILKKVTEAILESYKTNKRKILVIYLNPQHKNVFYEAGFTEYRVEKTNFYTEAILFALH